MLKIEEALNSLYRKIVSLRDDVQTALAEKQDIISAGDGISVKNNTVSIGPEDAVAQEGAAVTISVSAFGDAITYQWQYSATGASWANTTLSGNKTDTLSVTATSSRNGYHYRCQIKNGESVYISRPFRLVVIS